MYSFRMMKCRSGTISKTKSKFHQYRYTAVGVFKTSLLHKQIKNRPNLVYENSIRKCYEGLFFITNIHFNNPTSSPQT